MPVYRKGEVTIITKPPQDFIDRVAREQAEALAEARVAKMKLNLSHQEYKGMFDQYNRMKQESAQRLQRIEQHQQLRNQRLEPRIININSQENNNNSSSSNEQGEVVMRNLKFMQRIVGPNP